MMLADGGRWIIFLQSSAFPHRHRQPCFLSTLYVNGCMAFFCQCSICHLIQKQYFKLDFILLIVCRLDCVFFYLCKVCFIVLFKIGQNLIVAGDVRMRDGSIDDSKIYWSDKCTYSSKNWNVLDLNDESKSFYPKNAFKLFTSLSLSDLILGN